MLIKYRMLSSISIANFTSDIVGLLDGTITTVNGLSAGCDKTNTTISGTYPTGTFSKVGAGTNTFSKIHHQDNTVTHYFRMTFDSTRMTTFSVARSYTAGTDTLINSVAYTVNMAPNTFISTDQFQKGINIVITNKCVYFSSISSGISFGLFDLGANTITSTFTDSMRMAYIKTSDGSYGVPYTYSLLGTGISGYSALTGNLISTTTPIVRSNNSGSTVVIENPTFVTHINQGYQAFLVYGLFKIGDFVFAMDSVYNTSGTSRVASIGYTIPTE